jgi:DNA-binding MarR family transcriptional regulator
MRYRRKKWRPIPVRKGLIQSILLCVTSSRSSAPRSTDEYVLWAEFRYQIRLWTRISEEAALAAGLPPQHHQVLLALKGYPGEQAPRIADLAERMQLKHHSMVGLLDRMEKQGLIERVPLGGGRGVSIVLTREGDQAITEVSRVLRPKLRVAGRDLINALTPLVEPSGRTRRATASRRPSSRPRTAVAAPRAARKVRAGRE